MALVRKCAACRGPLGPGDEMPLLPRGLAGPVLDGRVHVRCVRDAYLRTLGTGLVAHEAVIAPQDGRAGRTFRAHLLGSVSAALWEQANPGNDDVRPALAVFAGSDEELRAFVANARTGRKVAKIGGGRRDERYEFLKSARYRVDWQRFPEGSTATLYLPALFALDPGMVAPDGARFVLLAGRAWAAAQRVDDEASIVAEGLRVLAEVPRPRNSWERSPLPEDPGGFVASMVPTALLFAAYLDRRTRAPILASPPFYMRLLIASLLRGLAVLGDDDSYQASRKRDVFGHAGALGFLEKDLLGAGYLPGVAFRATHEEVEALLADETLRASRAA